jgi:hypothetical protein
MSASLPHESMRITVVGAYATRADAEFAQATLASEGIVSGIQADDAGGAYPFDLSGAAHLLVDRTDIERARAILDAPSTHNDWTREESS